MGYFIGIDVGTQSTKTIVLDGESGRVLGVATKGQNFIDGLPPGHKEQDPAIWIDAVKETIAKAIRDSKISPKDIKAIGVSGQQHGLVPLDAKGKVIRPAKLWNDTSSREECCYLTKKLGGKRKVISLLGLAILPGFTAGKILWLKRNEPENFKKLATILLPHDYVNYYLTGEKVMEYGDASGTALLDIRKRKWCKKVLEIIDISVEKKLPRLESSDKFVGFLKKDVAEALGFSKKVLVSAGGGDNMMGAIGTGNVKEGVVTASLGTSGTIYAYSQKPVVDPKGEISGFCDSTGGWLPLLCTMNVGWALEFVRKLFGISYDEITYISNQVPAGSDGLLLFPYFEGERVPNIPNGTGIFYGLNTRTFDKAHIVRSAIEGVTLGMNYGLERMKKLGIIPREIRLTGGGSKNPLWRQIAADIFNSKIVCLKQDEGAAFGAAIQAVWAYLNWRDPTFKIGCPKITIQDIVSRYVIIDETTQALPNPKNVGIYKELQILHNNISKNVLDTFGIYADYLNKYVGAKGLSKN